MKSRHFLAWQAVAVVLSCPPCAEGAVVRHGQVVMGTVLAVTVVAEERSEADAMAIAAIAEARRWDDTLTIWRADGELGRLNASAGGGAVPVSDRLAGALEAMLLLSDRTAGAFEPGIGSMSLPGAPPTFPLRGIRRVLHLDRAGATLQANSALDPGAIGKGIALDAMVSLLRGRGATAAFLDFGGSSQAAVGVSPGDAQGWPVLLAGLAANSSHGTVHLRDASLSTSRAGADDTTPVLDPRTGNAVAAPRLATVLARDATSADAWSTALVVLGREGVAAASSGGMGALFEDGAGDLCTPGFP